MESSWLMVVVVVEVVFSYNALGQYLVDHVTKRDLPVVPHGRTRR